MTTKHTQLSWDDRFALIAHYNPTEDAVCKTFNLTPDEYETARTLLTAGTFTTSKTFDAVKYNNPFTMNLTSTKKEVTGTVIPVIKKSIKAKSSATTYTKPETATKKLKEPQKRGRKGNKIQNALLAVPMVQTPVDGFTKEYGVSLAVLRQSKRFISKMDLTVQQSIGTVKVRQDKDTKVLMIWRETNIK